MAEWLGTGLQNPLHRFDSGRRLLRMPRKMGIYLFSLLGIGSPIWRQFGNDLLRRFRNGCLVGVVDLSRGSRVT